MKNLLAFFKDEDGQGMVEYGLILGLIAVAAIVVLVALGPKIKDMFQKADDEMSKAATTTA